MQKFNFNKQQDFCHGHIELIIGPMFAGKSTELIRRVKRYNISGKKVFNIKYAEDNRYAKDSISTHDK